MASIFGYEITKKKKSPRSYASPENDDGAAIAAGGALGAYLDLDGSWKNEIDEFANIIIYKLNVSNPIFNSCTAIK